MSDAEFLNPATEMSDIVDVAVTVSEVDTATEALEAAAVTPQDPWAESEWETLPLPGSLSPDTLPEGEPIDLVTSLEQQNQTLRDRVEYLESALDQSQTSLRRELERWEALALQGDERIQEKEQAIARYMEEITVSQEKIAQLYQDLERSHQTTQRQHVLNETLKLELTHSQERQAQLERECAQIQQQYLEKAQLLLQQEHQSRDLQARLHRQQRYTLQYKAALEKCLEEPQSNTPTLPSEANISRAGLGKQVAIPKPSPVQPWSAPEKVVDPSQQAWLNAFLSESEQFPADDTLVNLEWQAPELSSEQPVSFDLNEIEPADYAAVLRLESWENAEVEQNNSVSVGMNDVVNRSASPFITLTALSEVLETTDENASRKRDSLAAVDLPSFSRPTELEPVREAVGAAES
jgi:hypothetical protein